MLKFLIFALVTLEIILLGALALSPANAMMSDSAVYTWEFASVGSNQVVCKQISLLPKDRLMPPSSPMQPVNISSIVVDKSYCANIAKPLIEDREISQN